MRLKFTLICLALVACLVVGCGGSSSSGTSGGSSESSSATSGGESSAPKGKPLTKAAFIKQGDAICAEIPQEYGETVAALEEEAKKEKKPKPSTEETNSKAAVPPITAAVEKFEKLVPPTGEEEKIEAIVNSLEAAGKGIEEEPKSELTGPKSPYAEFQKLTKAYGFSFCPEL